MGQALAAQLLPAMPLLDLQSCNMRFCSTFSYRFAGVLVVLLILIVPCAACHNYHRKTTLYPCLVDETETPAR